MGDAAGSDKRYAFRINCTGSTIHVFESTIDLLSYATIVKMKTSNWREDPLVSLVGVYAPSLNRPIIKIPAALNNALENNSGITTVALHLDSDYAGMNTSQAIADQLKDRYAIRDKPPPVGKDYNDYLMHIRQIAQSRRHTQYRSDFAR